MSCQLFIIDPIDKLNLQIDTSIQIAKAMSERGEQTYYCQISDLEFHSSQNGATAKCSLFDHNNPGPDLPNSATPKTIPLSNFRMIHMRKEPPVDEAFSHACRLLDLTPASTVLVNDPKALLLLNEKLAILHFPEFMDPCLISSDLNEMISFLKQGGYAEGVLKPLDGFGGKGVVRVNTESLKKMPQLKEHMILQPFNKSIKEGELRVFAVAGETISWCLKKPVEGSFLANTSSGATLHNFSPTPKLVKIVDEMNKKLLDMGISFVGYDIIGDRVSEINITSPRILCHDRDSYKVAYKRAADLLMELALK